MKINTNNMVSIAEAKKDFTSVANVVDKNGMAIIFDNNAPKYVVTEFSEYEREKTVEDEIVMRTAERLLDKHYGAFEEL